MKIFISGEPYCQNKNRGNIEGMKAWSQAVIAATKNSPKVTSACEVEINFVLPPNKYPADHPHGPDLDNLMKRLLDALNETIFSDVAGKDGAIVRVTASKRRSSENNLPGAHIEIREIDVNVV